MPDTTGKRQKRIFGQAVFSFFLLILMAGPAAGYVLDGRHILALMLEQMNLPTRMRIEQTLTVFDERLETDRMEVNQTAAYKLPENFRSEIKTENLHRIYVTAGGEALTVVDDKIVSQASKPGHHYKDLFCYLDRKALADHLAYLGINVGKSSYGRWKEKIAYVIGAQYPDESKPQLWIDKESFLPIRWLFQVDHPDVGLDRVEFRYKDWQQTAGSWYPGEIEIFHGQGLSRRIKVHALEIDPLFDDALFNIDHLRAVYEEPQPGATQPETQNDIDQQIKEFRDIFESE